MRACEGADTPERRPGHRATLGLVVHRVQLVPGGHFHAHGMDATASS
uniref:Uncharacterized protein n=1 Tax=Nonomuraea gerenzanensis TaxID=93944 RepID=A0A1M4DVB9_9ACTN|nr:hypothetical protein BN4615_P31 [Nonomuraea gerenzanensis]